MVAAPPNWKPCCWNMWAQDATVCRVEETPCASGSGMGMKPRGPWSNVGLPPRYSMVLREVGVENSMPSIASACSAAADATPAMVEAREEVAPEVTEAIVCSMPLGSRTTLPASRSSGMRMGAAVLMAGDASASAGSSRRTTACGASRSSVITPRDRSTVYSAMPCDPGSSSPPCGSSRCQATATRLTAPPCSGRSRSGDPHPMPDEGAGGGSGTSLADTSSSTNTVPSGTACSTSM
mmetsp:Transcript_23334/g.59713  ORF Transcript_23334/g.59713 Transcript_23334/m.59713 type:complete len:237 (-) Transcript_23334:401-1111(-)